MYPRADVTRNLKWRFSDGILCDHVLAQKQKLRLPVTKSLSAEILVPEIATVESLVHRHLSGWRFAANSFLACAGECLPYISYTQTCGERDSAQV